jgi:hypothetical protein
MERDWTGRTGAKKIERKDETVPRVSEDSDSARNEAWWRSAYRQGVHPVKALAEPPVDADTQLALEGVEGLAEGRFFRGPDTRFRPRTFVVLEDYDQTEIRRRAIAASTLSALERLREGDPHPGEEEAVARLRDFYSGAERQPGPTTIVNRPAVEIHEHRAAPAPSGLQTPASRAGKTGSSDRKQSLAVSITAQSAQDAAELARAARKRAVDKDPGIELPAPVPPTSARQDDILLAQSKGGSPKSFPGIPPGIIDSPAGGVGGGRAVPKSSVPGAGHVTPRQYLEKITGFSGKPANENQRPGLQSTAAAAPKSAVQLGSSPITIGGTRPNMTNPAPDDPDLAPTVFQRVRAGEKPRPEEFAIEALSAPETFEWLEEWKNFWSDNVETDRNVIYQDMAAKAKGLTVEAQRDFLHATRKEPTDEERAAIEETVLRAVFAPAQNWEIAGQGKGPHDKFMERPYLGIDIPPPIGAKEVINLFGDAARLMLDVSAYNPDGRKGSPQTQKAIQELADNVEEELNRCGVIVHKPRHAMSKEGERQIKLENTNKGSRYADLTIIFEFDGKTFTLEINHAGYYADGLRLKPNEQGAFDDIVRFRQVKLDRGEPNEEGAMATVPKQRKNQSPEEYHAELKKFAEALVDCMSEIKVRIDLNKNVRLVRPANANTPKPDESMPAKHGEKP